MPRVYALAELFARLPSVLSPGPPPPTTPNAGHGGLASSLAELAPDKYQLPATLPPGDRTVPLIKWIGSLVGKGHDAEKIEQLVRKANIERCPPGVPPIDDATLEAEVLPAIARFISQEDARRNAAQIQNVGTGTAISGFGEPADDNDDSHAKSADLGAFLSRYVFVEKDSLVIDLTAKISPERKLVDFKNAQANRVVISRSKTGYKYTPVTKLWLEHPKRQTVRDIIFYPKEDRYIEQRGQVYYNVFNGFDLQPMQSHWNDPDLRIFLEHLRYIFPTVDDIKRYLNWCAITVQRPYVRVPWLPLIVSTQGIGKGWLFQVFVTMLGVSNCAKIYPDDLGERKSGFNEYMSRTLLVCLDEMYTARRWDMMERLKPLITETELIINRKYGAKAQEKIYCNFLAFSNHEDAAALTVDDRRFWVIHSNAKPRDAEYYNKIYRWLQTDGPKKLLWLLNNYDISRWDYADRPPITDAKERMIEASKSPMEQCILDAIEDAIGPFVADIVDHRIVEQYVITAMDMDRLNDIDKRQIRHTLACLGPALKQSRYRVELPHIGVRRIRPRIVRNFDQWIDASHEMIAAEFTKAWSVSTKLI